MFDSFVDSLVENRALIGAIVAVGSLLLLLIRFVHERFRLDETVRAGRIHRDMQRSQGVPSFTKAEIKSALKYYVEPNCAQDDPSNEVDLRRVAEVRESVMRVVDRFIERGGGSKAHLAACRLRNGEDHVRIELL